MYENIGSKIKALAKVIGIGGIVICAPIAFILFLINFGNESNNLIIYILLSLLLMIICVVSSWPLYGFGELIENSAIIAQNTSGQQLHNIISEPEMMEKINELWQMKDKGLITEAEFTQKSIEIKHSRR